jgi:hypothetical protein
VDRRPIQSQAAVIAALVTARRCATSNCMKNKTESASPACCPPPAGVVVEIGEPPTGIGQLAALPKPEGTSPVKIRLPPIPGVAVSHYWLAPRALWNSPSRNPPCSVGLRTHLQSVKGFEMLSGP